MSNDMRFVAEAVALATEIKQAEYEHATSEYGGYPWEHLGDASRDIAVLIRGLLEAEYQLNALAEVQQFPVETVMAWKRRAEGAEAIVRYAKALLDPERQDESDEENTLRAFEALSGFPLSVEAGLPAALREAEQARAEADRLRAALRKYGTHKPTCAILKPPGLGRATEFTGQACDCGFAAALAGPQTEERGDA